MVVKRGLRGVRRKNVLKQRRISKPVKRPVKEASDEEILSESEDEEILEEKEVQSEFQETEGERRLRFAREYLKNVEAEVKEKEEFLNTDRDDEVSRILNKKFEKVERRDVRELADTRQRNEVRFVEIPSPTTSIAISRDERVFYVGAKDGRVYVYDLERLELTQIMNEIKRNTGVQSLASITDCGRVFCSGGEDKFLKFYDLREKRLVDAVVGPDRKINCLRYLRDSIYTTGEDRSITQWDVDTRRIFNTQYGHTRNVTSMNTDSARLYTSSEDRSCRVWNLDRDSHLIFDGHQSTVDAITPIDPTLFISGDQDGSIKLWSRNLKNSVFEISDSHLKENRRSDCWITSIGSCHGSDFLLSGATNGTLVAWKTSSSVSKKKSLFRLEKIFDIDLEKDSVCNEIFISKEAGFGIAAVAREYRHGRWFTGQAKNGFAFLDFSTNKD